MYRMQALSERRFKDHESRNYFLNVLCQTDNSADQTQGLRNARDLKSVQALYDGHGRGAELASANGTAWELIFSVIEFVDHERRARSQYHRLDSTWFSQSANLKQRALNYVLELVS